MMFVTKNLSLTPWGLSSKAVAKTSSWDDRFRKVQFNFLKISNFFRHWTVSCQSSKYMRWTKTNHRKDSENHSSLPGDRHSCYVRIKWWIFFKYCRRRHHHHLSHQPSWTTTMLASPHLYWITHIDLCKMINQLDSETLLHAKFFLLNPAGKYVAVCQQTTTKMRW